MNSLSFTTPESRVPKSDSAHTCRQRVVQRTIIFTDKNNIIFVCILI